MGLGLGMGSVGSIGEVGAGGGGMGGRGWVAGAGALAAACVGGKRLLDELNGSDGSMTRAVRVCGGHLNVGEEVTVDGVCLDRPLYLQVQLFMPSSPHFHPPHPRPHVLLSPSLAPAGQTWKLYIPKPNP